MHPRSQRLVDPALARRLGVLHRAEVPRALDDRVVDREVASGRWARPVPSVTVDVPDPDEEQLRRAALLHGAPHGVLTGRTACRLYRLRDVPAGGPVQVLLPHGVRRVSTPAVQVLRTRARVEVRSYLGLPVAAPARAVADAVRSGASLREARALVLAAVHDQRLTLADLQVHSAPGTALLRRVLADAARGAASAPEAECADLLAPWARRLGLTVLLNPWLVLDGALLCVPDAYLPEVGLGVETDSVEHHGTGGALSRTLGRHRRVERAGVGLLHETPWALRHEPEAVLARLDEELLVGRTPPSGLVVLAHDDPAADRWRPARRPLGGVPRGLLGTVPG